MSQSTFSDCLPEPAETITKRVPEDQKGAAGDVCPICGGSELKLWLQAPDRFHGRREEYTLLRCTECSLVWLKNPPTLEEMDQHYTSAYHKLISSAGDGRGGRWKARKEDLGRFKQSGALLDLGCSSGMFLESVQNGSWTLYGIEMSAGCAEDAKARCGAQVFVGNIADAPFANETFDAITCFDVLEHLHEPRKVVSRVANWLKPGGVFYVQVPNIDSAEARVFRTYWHGLELPRHLFHYTPDALRKLAALEGLTEVMLETRRNPAVGASLRYVGDDLFRAAGVHRKPLAYQGKASLPVRAVRKLSRLTLQRLLLAMAPLAGEGEAIHAIFRKDGASVREGSFSQATAEIS